jgi:hypothetical protein
VFRRTLSRINRLLGRFSGPPILKNARVSPPLKARLSLEALDRRDVPTVYMWTGAVSTAANNPDNWLAGSEQGQLPSYDDTPTFVGQLDPLNPAGRPSRLTASA